MQQVDPGRCEYMAHLAAEDGVTGINAAVDTEILHQPVPIWVDGLDIDDIIHDVVCSVIACGAVSAIKAVPVPTGGGQVKQAERDVPATLPLAALAASDRRRTVIGARA